MFKLIQFLLLLYLLSSCKNIQYGDKELPVLDIEANISNMKPVYLSQFTDDVEYIPFEYVENKPYVQIINVFQDYILIKGGDVILLYNSGGKFISQIGKRGRGPGEYPYGTFAKISLNGNRIFVVDGYDLLEYRMDGSFVNSYHNILRIEDKYKIGDWMVLGDSLLFGFVENGTGKVPYKAVISNKNGGILNSFKNYFLFENEKGGTFYGSPVFFYMDGTLYSKEQFNDTVFFLNERLEMIPRYVIKLGKYELPLEIRMRRPMGDEYMNYISVHCIFPTDNYLLLQLNFGNLMPSKRITPKKFVPGPFDMWRDVFSVIAVYDTRTRELVFSKPTDSDNPLFTSGIYNDIDCGPRFIPGWLVNDSTMM